MSTTLEHSIPFNSQTKQFASDFPSQFASEITPENFDACLEQINKISPKHEEPIRVQALSLTFIALLNSVYSLVVMYASYKASAPTHTAKQEETVSEYGWDIVLVLFIAQFIGALFLCIAAFMLLRRVLKFRSELDLEVKRVSSEEENVSFELVKGWLAYSITMRRKYGDEHV